MNKQIIKIIKSGNFSFTKKKAYSLTILLIMLIGMSMTIVAAIPLFTKLSENRTNLHLNTIKCIKDDDLTGWYDSSTGVSSLPSGGTACYSAVLDAKYNRNGALTNALWYTNSNNATAEQQSLSKKLLRAACDQGGEKACDYFINECIKNGSLSSPYCDDDTNFEDITYYLHLPADTENLGALYIKEQLESLLPQMKTNLINEVYYACINNQSPDYNQNLNSNLACDLKGEWLYITACNLGYTAACTEAQSQNYNKSCTQIKDAWPDAPTDVYKLTYKYDGTPGSLVSVNCNMSSIASAAITGCNAISDFSNNCTSTPPDSGTNCSDDCLIAYNSSFNTSCDAVFSSWTLADEGLYNITSNGPPPTNPVSTSCTIPAPSTPPPPPVPDPATAPPSCGYDIGEVLADGSVFAGYYNGYCYFTTPADEPGYPSADNLYAWGASGYNLYHARNEKDGANNTRYIIKKGLADTYAAEVCDSKTDFGYTDWFLPAKWELNNLLFNNKDFIGGFASAYYWSSTEYNDTYSNHMSLSSASISYDQKTDKNRVRCIRKERYPTYVAPDPANCEDAPGNVCSDDTIYAGDYNGYHYYTTAYDEPQGAYPLTYMYGVLGYNLSTAISSTDGQANTTALLNSGYADIEAALACQAKNDSLDNGHNDWFLPAYNELRLLSTNNYAIGNFLNAFNYYYWSSTQGTSIWWNYGFHIVIKNGEADESAKDKYLYVRCVRKDSI